jgi:hypothetical protein
MNRQPQAAVSSTVGRFVRCDNCKRIAPWLDAADITTHEGTRTLCQSCADVVALKAMIHHGFISPNAESEALT